ncbi:MAG: efflux RND transporter periplasmic adaptor subunit [Crocinitomicaceae bacterium]
MKLKNVIIPVFTALIGLLIGYFIFRDNAKSPVKGKHQHEQTKVTDKEQIWTCSMHPQIRQSEPGNCPICGMELIPLDETHGSNPLQLEMSDAAVKLAQIQTTTVGRSDDVSPLINLSGKVKANETTSASLVSHIPGRIERLYVSFTGEEVYRGQKIATIYSPLLITAQKELLEAYKLKDEQPQLYKAASNKLKFWKITDEQIDEILSSEEIKENFDIYADYSGVVQKRRVSVGDHLKEGEVLFDIQNLHKLWIVFDVYEKDLPLVKVGSLISFTTPSVPGKTFEAKISFVDPVIDSKTRTAKVRVNFINKNHLLKPEMLVKGKLYSKENTKDELTVPKSAVLWTGERSVVYVEVPGMNVPTYEFREVTIGESVGDKYKVLDGLVGGEEVVTQGNFVIDASAQLNNQQSMMNRLIKGAVTEEVLPNYAEKTPTAFKMDLAELNQAYLALKDALVNSDASLTKKRAKQLLIKLSEVDMSQVDGESHFYWMEKAQLLKDQTKQVFNQNKLEDQRMYFSDLSNTLIDINKVYGVEDNTIYIQYCPMANNKVGAYWLSTSPEIKNPYFGDKMLGCGETTLILKDNSITKATEQSNL